MRTRKVAGAAFTGAAAVATLGLTAPAATAVPASTWHLQPGNGTAFGVQNIDNPVLVDTATGFTITCTVATGTGHWTGDGKTARSASLATISTATFGTSANPCSEATIPFVWKLKRATTLWGSQYANGVTAGHFGNGATSAISASLNGVGSISCHVEIRGATLPTKYVNANHSFNVDAGHAATLHVTSVKGCLGLYEPGDSLYVSVLFSTDPAATISYRP